MFSGYFFILMDDFIVILYFELYDPGPESPDLKRDDRVLSERPDDADGAVGLH